MIWIEIIFIIMNFIFMFLVIWIGLIQGERCDTDKKEKFVIFLYGIFFYGVLSVYPIITICTVIISGELIYIIGLGLPIVFWVFILIVK